MNTRNVLVSFIAIAFVLALTTVVSAADDLATITSVNVDGMNATQNNVAVVAGETVTIEVWFTANICDTDVTIEAEIEGEKVKVDTITAPFDVEADHQYREVLKLQVPFELKDDRSDNIELNIEIDGKNHYGSDESYILRVQRPSYNPVIKSISIDNKVAAGETLPVEIVVKNIGYNDLDDLYVTASLSALGIQKSAYLGDLIALDCCEDDDEYCGVGCDDDYDGNNQTASCNSCCDDDDEDTVSGILYLKVPYDVDAGVYTVEVEVSNDDATETKVAQVVVENDFSSNVVVTSTSKTVAVGEDAEYSLLIVNPTNKLKVFRVVAESNGDLSTSASETVVAVPAGASKTVTVTANADAEGTYTFAVNVFDGESLSDSVTYVANVEGKSKMSNSPIVILTIVLAVVFLVLLIVLIVLLGKKPEKSEEFGECYY